MSLSLLERFDDFTKINTVLGEFFSKYNLYIF